MFVGYFPICCTHLQAIEIVLILMAVTQFAAANDVTIAEKVMWEETLSEEESSAIHCK